jgi:hypothetical protein
VQRNIGFLRAPKQEALENFAHDPFSRSCGNCCQAFTMGGQSAPGHFCQLEVPDQVNAMIDRFIALERL